MWDSEPGSLGTHTSKGFPSRSPCSVRRGRTPAPLAVRRGQQSCEAPRAFSSPPFCCSWSGGDPATLPCPRGLGAAGRPLST